MKMFLFEDFSRFSKFVDFRYPSDFKFDKKLNIFELYFKTEFDIEIYATYKIIKFDSFGNEKLKFLDGLDCIDWHFDNYQKDKKVIKDPNHVLKIISTVMSYLKEIIKRKKITMFKYSPTSRSRSSIYLDYFKTDEFFKDFKCVVEKDDFYFYS